MTLSITKARALGDDLPLFAFNFRNDQELEDALDAWLANDRIDEPDHVYAWTDDEEVE